MGCSERYFAKDAIEENIDTYEIDISIDALKNAFYLRLNFEE
jgi:hypothetical protein